MLYDDMDLTALPQDRIHWRALVTGRRKEIPFFRDNAAQMGMTQRYTPSQKNVILSHIAAKTPKLTR